MDFDWKSIAGAVAPIAPKLGAVLGTSFGGPLGGLVGGIAGRAVAGAFGVEATPEAVGEAIAKDKNAVEKLRILEATRGVEIVQAAQVEIERLKAEALQAESIGVTQRAEIASGVSWWHWRHLGGYLILWYGLLFSLGLPGVVFGVMSAADLTALVTATTPIFLALCALQGYVAHDTSSRIRTAITGQTAPNLIGATVSKLSGR